MTGAVWNSFWFYNMFFSYQGVIKLWFIIPNERGGWKKHIWEFNSRDWLQSCSNFWVLLTSRIGCPSSSFCQQRHKGSWICQQYCKLSICNKLTLYLWIWVGKSVAHRRDKPSSADKSSALHLQICATQTSISISPWSSRFYELWANFLRGKQCNALKNTHIFRCVSGPTLYSPL